MPNLRIENINHVFTGDTGNTILNLSVLDPNYLGRYECTYVIDKSNDTPTSLSANALVNCVVKTETANENQNLSLRTISNEDTIYPMFPFNKLAVKSLSNSNLYGPLASEENFFLDCEYKFCKPVSINSKIMTCGISTGSRLSPVVKGTTLRDTRNSNVAISAHTRKMLNSDDTSAKLTDITIPTYLMTPLADISFTDILSRLSTAANTNSVIDNDSVAARPESYFDFISKVNSYTSLGTDYLLGMILRPRYNLTNIYRNYIYQIPASSRNIPTDESSILNTAEVRGEFLLGKNAYDSNYSMNMSNNNTLSLKNTRLYNDIGSCGGKLFLKYTDNINFDYNTVSDSSKITDETSNVKKLTPKYSHGLINIGDSLPYQKIETLDSASHFKSVSKHKSNLFSVKIRKLFDDETAISDSLKSNNNTSDTDTVSDIISAMKSDISRSVSKIVDTLSPAHTQLFDIKFTTGQNNTVSSGADSQIKVNRT